MVNDGIAGTGIRLGTTLYSMTSEFAAGIYTPETLIAAVAENGIGPGMEFNIAQLLRTYRNYGSQKKYHNLVQGFNSRLDEMQAAFLNVKLDVLEEGNARRRAIAARYADRLAGIDDLTLPTVPAWADPVWHLYVVRHARRDALSARLADAGIGTIVHYPIPPHLQQAYAELGYKEGDFPIAEAIHREVLSLPIGPHMTLEQADIVADAVRTALTNLS